MENQKMPLEFISGAVKAAKNEMLNIYENSSAVHATKQFTVFFHNNEFLVLQGNLHDKVEAPYCVEFDMVFRYGNVAIQTQRNFI